MKMICRCSSYPGSSTLDVHLFFASHHIASPLADEVGTQEIVEPDDASGIAFQPISYHLDAPGVCLPPLLLIEPCDDPDSAERDYDLHQGYRYIGQLLLPDGQRGERVDVVATREALALIEKWLPRSVLHQQALALYRQAQDRLLRLDPQASDTPDLNLPARDQGLLWRVSQMVQSTDATTRLAGLGALWDIDASALPLAQVFPCLGDTDTQVRQAALFQLARVVERLSARHLYQVSCEASLPVRIAAMALLGLKGGEEAASWLNCISVCGPLCREHPSERMALLDALAQACTSLSPDDLTYRDLFESLCDTAEVDPHAEVRAHAERWIEALRATTHTRESSE